VTALDFAMRLYFFSIQWRVGPLGRRRIHG